MRHKKNGNWYSKNFHIGISVYDLHELIQSRDVPQILLLATEMLIQYIGRKEQTAYKAAGLIFCRFVAGIAYDFKNN